MEKIRLGVFPLFDAKQLKAELATQGIELELAHNQATCSRGSCGVTVEAFIHPQHLPVVSRIFTQHFAKNLGVAEFDVSQIDQVYDPSQSEAICPACGFTFSTTHTECPDCGLVLG